MPFKNASDPEIIAKSAAVAEVFTPEKYAYLLSLIPTSAGFAELSNRLGENYPAVLKGDPDKTKEFEADRKALDRDLAVILGVGRAVTVHDPDVLESLNLGHVSERSGTGPSPLS